MKGDKQTAPNLKIYSKLGAAVNKHKTYNLCIYIIEKETF